MPIEIGMRYERSTKGTHVYAETRENSAVRTLYIIKSAMPTPAPYIILTIEGVAEEPVPVAALG